MKRAARESGRKVVAVGILGPDAIRDDGSNNAVVAASNEYGVPEKGIPERSFMRSTIDGGASKYRRFGRHAAGAIAAGTMTVDQALGQLGAGVVSDIQRTIQRGVPPPNSPITVARKGSSKTLIDEAQMIQALNWEVRDK